MPCRQEKNLRRRSEHGAQEHTEGKKITSAGMFDGREETSQHIRSGWSIQMTKQGMEGWGQQTKADKKDIF